MPHGDSASRALCVPCARWTVYTGWAIDAQAPWWGPLSQQWSSLGAEGVRGAGGLGEELAGQVW